MTLSTQLWSENSDLASEALTHPFVCRLGDGSLAREISTGYLAQDAFFLESFARAYALALAHSPDTPTLLALADLLAGVREELDCTPPTPPGGASTWPASSLHRRPWPTPSSCSRPLRRAGWGWCSRPWLRACGSTHGLARHATRVRRDRRRSGCRPTLTRILRYGHPAGTTARRTGRRQARGDWVATAGIEPLQTETRTSGVRSIRRAASSVLYADTPTHARGDVTKQYEN